MDPQKQKALAAWKLETYHQRKRGVKHPSVALKIPKTMWMKNYSSSVADLLRKKGGTEVLSELPAAVPLENLLEVLCDENFDKELRSAAICYIVHVRHVKIDGVEFSDTDLSQYYYDREEIRRISARLHKDLLKTSLDVVFNADKRASWILARRICFVYAFKTKYFESQIMRLLHPLHGHCKSMNSIHWLNAMYGFQSALLDEEDDTEEQPSLRDVLKEGKQALWNYQQQITVADFEDIMFDSQEQNPWKNEHLWMLGTYLVETKSENGTSFHDEHYDLDLNELNASNAAKTLDAAKQQIQNYSNNSFELVRNISFVYVFDTESFQEHLQDILRARFLARNSDTETE